MDWLVSIVESIKNLPNLIFEGIKSIFVPDTEVIKNQFDSTIQNIQGIFNLNIDSFEGLFNSMSEQPVTDVKGEYNINGLGTMEITFLKADYLRQGVDFFRPFIRGFIVLLLLLYHYKQILTFIGQDPSISHNAEKNYNEWRDKQ